MVLSHGRSSTSWPRSSCEKLVRKEFIHQYMIAFKMMKYFMQASYNITGRKNGANIWITSSLSRTIGTIRYVVSFSVRSETNGKRTHPDYHQTTRAIVSMNKKAGQIQASKRRHNYRKDLDQEKLDWLGNGTSL